MKIFKVRDIAQIPALLMENNIDYNEALVNYAHTVILYQSDQVLAKYGINAQELIIYEEGDERETKQ